MRPIHCIIVDDEPLARDLISTYVGALAGWKTVMICKNSAEAYEALYQNEVDVIFLDIKMPVVSGIDFLHSLRDPPRIIFTTAYPEYAVNAFDLRAVDYLVKPITRERFLQAVEKLETFIGGKMASGRVTSGTAVSGRVGPESTAQIKEEPDHVFLKQDGRLVKVPFADILYVEALKDFSKVYLAQKTMLVGTHLKLMEEILPRNKFVRVHRSYIIALGRRLGHPGQYGGDRQADDPRRRVV